MIVQQFVGVLRDRPSWNDALVTLRNDVRAGMALREAADAYDALHAGGRSELAGGE